MNVRIRGKAWKFGEHISTDHIIPGRFLERDYSEMGQFAMAGVDEAFSSKVTPGDVIVAGRNFGCGSSREAAPVALKAAGIAAVIAPSFSRIFLRNAINQGLPPIVVPDVDHFHEGDVLVVDLEDYVVRNESRGAPVQPILNLRGVTADILRAGGIVTFARQRIGLE